MYFGVLIMIERLGFGKILEKLPGIVSLLYTFFMVVIGWVFFDINGLKPAASYLAAMFGANGTFIDSTAKYLLVSNIFIFIVAIICSTELVKKFYVKINSLNSTAVGYAMPIIQFATLIICTAYLVDATYNPFLYFRF